MRERVNLMATSTVIGTAPASIDLQVYQGDDFFLEIDVDDSVVPIDLTNYIAKAEIRSAPGGSLLATFDPTVVDPTTILLHLTAVQSVKLTKTSSWDVQVTDPAGVVTTLAYGHVTVILEVTQ